MCGLIPLAVLTPSKQLSAGLGIGVGAGVGGAVLLAGIVGLVWLRKRRAQKRKDAYNATNKEQPEGTFHATHSTWPHARTQITLFPCNYSVATLVNSAQDVGTASMKLMWCIAWTHAGLGPDMKMILGGALNDSPSGLHTLNSGPLMSLASNALPAQISTKELAAAAGMIAGVSDCAMRSQPVDPALAHLSFTGRRSALYCAPACVGIPVFVLCVLYVCLLLPCLQDPFLQSVAPSYRWCSDPLTDMVAVEEGVNAGALAAAAAADQADCAGPSTPTHVDCAGPPPVQLTMAEVQQQIEIMAHGMIDRGERPARCLHGLACIGKLAFVMCAWENVWHDCLHGMHACVSVQVLRRWFSSADGQAALVPMRCWLSSACVTHTRIT